MAKLVMFDRRSMLNVIAQERWRLQALLTAERQRMRCELQASHQAFLQEVEALRRELRETGAELTRLRMLDLALKQGDDLNPFRILQ